jgi:nucleoside-diphosphate-sugar epimerase
MGYYFVTGAAGFIASRVAEFLIKDGHTVLGIDNMNDAYDVRMKEYRLRRLQAMPGFTFHSWIFHSCQQLKTGSRRSSTWLRGQGFALVWKIHGST